MSRAIRFLACLLLGCSAPSLGATWRWTGADPGSSAWSRPQNWDLMTAPANDGSASLVFRDNAASVRHDPVADSPWNLASLEIQGDDPYQISGALLSLHGGIWLGGNPPFGLVHRISNDIRMLDDAVWSNPTGATLVVAGDVDIGAHRLTLVPEGFGPLIQLQGDVSGSGGLVKDGSGAVRLSGNNSYTGGTTVLFGLLTAASPHAIPPGTVTVKTGHLDLGTSGNVLGPGAASLDGLVLGGAPGSAASVSGLPIRIESLGDWIVYDATGDPGETLLSGTLDLATAGSRVIRIEDSATTTEELTVLSQIMNSVNGSGPEPAIRKRGPGRLILTGICDYRRALQIDEGVVRLGRGNAVGASSTGDATIVLAGASLELSGPFTVLAEPLRLNGSGVLGSGALRSDVGSHGWGGPVTLESDATVAVPAADQRLTITGSVNGSGGLVKIGDGALVMTSASSYQGSTLVSGGTLRADNVFGNAVPGTVTVASSATLAGDGSIGGAVVVQDGGRIEPAALGSATSSLTAQAVTFSQASTLHLSLVSNGNSGRLDALGLAQLAGRLEVDLVPPYAPAAGHAFTLVRYASRSGQFGQLSLPPLPNGLEWALSYGPDALVLVVSCPMDSDGDGLGDACDCAPADAGAFAVPAEAQNLRWVTRDMLAWDSVVRTSGSLSRHDVVRGNLASVSFLGTGAEDVCVAEALDAAQLQDPSPDPPSGSGYFYLVRGRNACGHGRYETTSAGQDRTTSACAGF